MMKKKYNAEKVLYFADGDQGLHVSPSEKDRNTDLHQSQPRRWLFNSVYQ